MTRKSRRPHPSSAAARERRFDAIQRRRYRSYRNPDEGLCYDAQTGTLSGDPSSPYAGLEVEIAAIFEDTNTVLVRHASLPDNELIVPLCVGPQITAREPTAQPPPDITGCCIDPDTGLIECPGGKAQWSLHGEIIPPEDRVCMVVEGGQDFCAVQTPTGTFDVPQCPKQPPKPPECCYDVATGRLRCEPPGSTWDGMQVSLLALQPQADGSIVAIVMSPGFAPENSTQIFPICDDPVVDCCYDPTTQTLMCPGNALDGVAAGIVASWVAPDGQIWVWAAWEGGGAKMPLCPGTDECPPVFCCINLQTFTFICPGRPELNGQEAPLVDIVTEDGYSWGILEDGSRVPMCGERCPPPRLCPDCPTCPPGQWMSPDGTCTTPPQTDPCPPGMWRDPNGNCVPPPQCPECPPGTLLDTRTGECVTCPRCPQCPAPPADLPRFRPKTPCCDGCARGGPCSGRKRNPEPCCDSCAKGGPCTGCAKKPNPHFSRKRRILSGN